MDFLNPRKKRSHKRLLYLGYILIAVAVGLGSFILLLFANGYSFSRTGDVYKNGLVFLNSRPGSATAVIESMTRAFNKQEQTEARLVLREGRYRITLTKDGYRTWQREFNLEGGDIERIVYPLLFPEKLEPAIVQEYKKPTTFVTTSPDRRWLVLQQPGSIGTFQIFDANASVSEQRPRIVTLPTGVLTSSTAKRRLELVEWSTDNKHFLVKHSFKNRHEFVVVNFDQPNESFNVNKVFGGSYRKVVLHDKKAEQLYLLSKVGGSLQLGAVKTAAKATVKDKVLDFHPYGKDMLLYVTPNPKHKKVIDVRLQAKTTDYKLRELPKDDTYLIDLAQFDGAWFIAVGSPVDNRVYVYKNPLEWLQNPATNAVTARTLRIQNPRQLSFSANTQFIAVQSRQNFSVYDVFTDRQYNYKINYKFDGKVNWMDGHRLTGVSRGKVIVFDYDGINVQKLVVAEGTTLPLFDRDYKTLYTYAPTGVKGRYALTRTNLVLNN